MEVLFERVAGLDVGKDSVVVCVRTQAAHAGRRRGETRTFSTMSRSLGLMRTWLVEQGVTIAAIESTSTYWKPPFYALEEVMDVLDGLRERDRAVGIVSHVADLRSRIPAQLLVRKGRHGSTLALAGREDA